jgi:hypothetical protein
MKRRRFRTDHGLCDGGHPGIPVLSIAVIELLPCGPWLSSMYYAFVMLFSLPIVAVDDAVVVFHGDNK